MHSILLERVAAVAALEVDAQGPETPPGPVAVRITRDVVSRKFANTVWRTASTFKDGFQEPGLPLVVSASMQIAPPAVT